jgi:hypothetical protein
VRSLTDGVKITGVRDTGDEDPPPFLSTWTRVYAAILLLEAVVIALVALFSRGRY